MVNYITDTRLSLKAKGLMTVLLHLQKAGEAPNVTNVLPLTTGKYPAVRTGLRELAQLGYYKSIRHREVCGFSYSYELKEEVDENVVVTVEEDE